MVTANPQPYNFVLQKYLLLQEQHEELSNHLEQIRPRQPSVSSASTTSSSPDISPNRLEYIVPTAHSGHSRRADRARARAQARCSGWINNRRGSVVLDTIPDEDTLDEISAEEQQLLDVNESIKRALTELLNSDIIRKDMSMRMWAQSRLMEAEKELRSGRRRRSSPRRE